MKVEDGIIVLLGVSNSTLKRLLAGNKGILVTVWHLGYSTNKNYQQIKYSGGVWGNVNDS